MSAKSPRVAHLVGVIAGRLSASLKSTSDSCSVRLAGLAPTESAFIQGSGVAGFGVQNQSRSPVWAELDDRGTVKNSRLGGFDGLRSRSEVRPAGHSDVPNHAAISALMRAAAVGRPKSKTPLKQTARCGRADSGGQYDRWRDSGDPGVVRATPDARVPRPGAGMDRDREHLSHW
jgi:hypothetical protein